jgi:hypothetical protein
VVRNEVQQLATLINERNDVSMRIAQLIGRPAQIGHVGEWIASKIFDVELENSAVVKGIDGRFRSGSLVGKSVNVKYYAKLEYSLAIRDDALPEYYLVFTGSRSKVMTSRGDARLWFIDWVFLFDAKNLCESLLARASVKIDPFATSVCRQLWQDAEIYPAPSNPLIRLDDRQKSLLRLFSSTQRLESRPI